MKVKANKKFNGYRLITLEGLDKKDFRDLQQGKTVDIPKELYDKRKYLFTLEKESPKVKEK